MLFSLYIQIEQKLELNSLIFCIQFCDILELPHHWKLINSFKAALWWSCITKLIAIDSWHKVCCVVMNSNPQSCISSFEIFCLNCACICGCFVFGSMWCANEHCLEPDYLIKYDYENNCSNLCNIILVQCIVYEHVMPYLWI